MGLTVGDGAVDGRAQVRWALRQGRMEQVVLRVDGVGNDLEVTGGNVGRVERQGSRVVVTLREPSMVCSVLPISATVTPRSAARL